MTTTSTEETARLISSLREKVLQAGSDAEARMLSSRIAQITRQYRIENQIGLPRSIIDQALEVDEGFRRRLHLEHLSARITRAVRDVERGKSRMVAVSMPPRSGKSTLLSNHFPLWLLRRHPAWKIIMASYDGGLTSTWARNIRTQIEDKPDLGIALKRDGGAGSRWDTIENGGMYATSVRGSITGRGAKVMLIDDPVKDFVEAHSASVREGLWNWWLSVAQTRLEPPFLVIVVMTRWHEDDFVGRLMSKEHEGDPADWEYIRLPAIAGSDDVLGRENGAPLISPLVNETPEQAVVRWDDVKRTVGSYTFSAMYQQSPAPAKGAIFDSGWWRYWTTDPAKATDDGRVVYLRPDEIVGGTWLDSWDCAFKGADDSDFVVAQRWVKHRANRYLVAQKRGRWSFTQTIKEMKRWSATDDPFGSPYGRHVHKRLIEEKANGSAIIDVLKDEIAGLKPINPTGSKEARARAITPEVESGNTYLPHPTDTGNDWVADLLSELRNFPFDAHDDQVDTLTQALGEMHDSGRANITVPGQRGTGTVRIDRNLATAARSSIRRLPGR